jgi:hypothetical protein
VDKEQFWHSDSMFKKATVAIGNLQQLKGVLKIPRVKTLWFLLIKSSACQGRGFYV